jgi:RNA polymerase sigma-70 factor (ECF subfamily)
MANMGTCVVWNVGGDDAALCVALRAGDPAAFEQVVRTHGGPLLRVCRRILRNEDDAHDAVQDTFLALSRHAGSFSGASRLSTWLYRIAVNAALMKLRRRRPETPLDDLLPAFDTTGRLTGDEGTLPEADLMREETRLLVRRAIERLPETHRNVLILRDIEEHDTRTTAELLGVSPNAVKIRLHRARLALRALLVEELQGERP